MLRIATALILVALGGGCPAADTDTSSSDGGPGGTDPKHSNSDEDAPVMMAAATVSSAGGEVKTEGGELAVRVPSGALDHNVKVTVESTTAPAPGSVGTVFEIGPTGTQFKQPVTIALKYDDQDMSDLRVATYGNGAWQVLPNYVVDTEHHTIAGDTMHLSPYALVRVSSGQTCSTRSVGCGGSTAPRADTGTGGSGGYSGSGSSTGGAGASAIDAGAAEFDAGVKADAPPPQEPPPSDVPPEKQDGFAAPSVDGGTGGGTAADGGTEFDASKPIEEADAGVRPAEPEKLPVESTCDVKPTCASAPACGGMSGAIRTACRDTDTGFEETCCSAATMSTDGPNTSVRDAGVDVGSGGSSAADAGTAIAPDASVPSAPDGEPKPETGGSGADTGSGGSGGSGTAGTSSADAGVPQPPKG